MSGRCLLTACATRFASHLTRMKETPVFYINDVGQAGWEEVDLGVAGANYGWPPA